MTDDVAGSQNIGSSKGHFFKKFRLHLIIFIAAAFVSLCPAQQQPGNLDKVYSLMKMTQADRDVTCKLKDQTPDALLDNAFYWMMKKVSALPQLSKEELLGLDSPLYANILRQPDRYRFMPMRMKVYVYTVQKLTTNQGHLTANPYWPGDRPIYRISATNQAAGENHRAEPLIIYSAELPAGLPDNPRQGENGALDYPTGPVYDIAGVFIKYSDEVSRDKKLIVSYPVIIAWQLDRLQALPVSNTLVKLAGLIAVLIIVLAVSVYLFLKKRVRKIRKSAPVKEIFDQYREINAFGQLDDTNDKSAIPPELSQAAKDFRQQHGLDDEPRKE